MGRAKTTIEKVQVWDITSPLLTAMHLEFRELSKKKPEGALNKQKIAMTNRLLERCRSLLEDEPSHEFLDLLNEEDVPQNSDVVLVLSQYVAAMISFKEKYRDYGQWYTK